ncbi:MULTISPECIES: hypothetical protein [Rossellomorea]|uniref:hypothetical protein n=1 Tax=Rossellomorea TaxID=2837508 RepID=UPI0011E8993A|nr:hypothetical protein [Rossellomorea marisflavi]TYO69741.1 hypothetical protein DQ398_003583 [Rossellomorea marisflavi]
MKGYYAGAAFFLAGFLALSACSQESSASADGDQKAASQEQTDQSDDVKSDEMEEAQGTSESDKDEMDDSSEEKDEQTSGEQPEENQLKVEEEKFETAEKAAGSIKDYSTVEQTNADLGHGLKALQEGAAGHEYVSWNEGNWLIRVDFPTDEQYAIDGYDGGLDMAKEVVAYLEEHTLPAPHDRGIITINGFKEHPGTEVKWQDGKTVYTIDSEDKNPFNAIQRAVDEN